MMKKNIIFCSILFLFLSGISVQAQHEGPPPPPMPNGAFNKPPRDINPGMIVMMKYDYVKNNLRLNESESPRFWKLYDQYIKDEQSYHVNFTKSLRSKGFTDEQIRGNMSDLPENKKILLMDMRMKLKDQMHNLDMRFYYGIKSFLSPHSLISYYEVDHDFKMQCARGKGNLEHREMRGEKPFPPKMR